MALRGGRKLSREEAAAVQSRGRGDLSEYENTFSDLAEGEGFTYEIEEGEKSMTERSRWSTVAGRQGFSFRFSSKKEKSTGQITCSVVKGTPAEGESVQSTGKRRS